MQMISIIYSERDYEAANIALKVQSLSQNQPVSIYIVPKHYGRNRDEVYQKLNKTKTAIFLAVDSKTVDNETWNELVHLMEKRKTIKYIVPSRYNLNGFEANPKDVYRYAPNANLVHNLSSTISEINKQVEKEKKDN